MMIGKAGDEPTNMFGRQSVHLFEVKSDGNTCTHLTKAINQICACNTGIRSNSG